MGAVIIIFSDKKTADEASARVAELKQKLLLADDFEFHLSRNNLRIQSVFLSLISNLDFLYIYVSVRKTKDNNYGSYSLLVDALARKLIHLSDKIAIKMDDNPIFYKELSKNRNKLKFSSCKQVHSKNWALVQVADYVVSLATKELRRGKIDNPAWKKIKKKEIKF